MICVSLSRLLYLSTAYTMLDHQRFNPATTLARLDNDEALLKMLIGVFAQEMPIYLNGLTDALEAGSWALLRAAAHRVKGASGSLGLNVVYEQALNLEDFCASGLADAKPQEAVKLAHQLIEELAASLEVANRWAQDPA